MSLINSQKLGMHSESPSAAIYKKAPELSSTSRQETIIKGGDVTASAEFPRP